MSGHEHERLSAYLDDALAEAERAEVEAHLRACADCAARLAELAAVDAAVRSAPAGAPAGYFESFPPRLRARLEPKARPRRLPAWTWAAAAALLLAVVTPLTLLRRPAERAGMASPVREMPAAAAPELAKAQAQPDAGAPIAPAAEPKPETPAQRPVPALASPLPAKRESAFASPPSEADASAARPPAAPAVAQSVAPAPPVAAREAAREEEAAAALSDTGAIAESVSREARNQAKASADRKDDEPRDAAAATAGDETAPGRARAAGAAVGTLAAPKLVNAAAEWQRLDTARPRSLSEWRRLREDWRRFAARDAGAAQADEARVRTIEAGHEAWQAGGDPADEELFRRDAASYLQRDDAAQKERVARLLR